MRILLFFLVVFFTTGATAQSLTGNVVDENGSPISGAEVVARNGAGTENRTTTGGDGTFSIAIQITPQSRLTVTAAGFAFFERQISNDGVRDFTIVLRPAPLVSDVIVSITGVETRLNETPASVIVLDRERLANTAAQTPDDALRQVAGFSLFRRSSSKTSNPTTQGANLRGLAGSGASRTSVLLDGLSINDAFGGWTYWSRVPRVAVERVEVLRGGASSLYGTSALSGAIDFQTSGSTNNDPILRVDASAGSQGTFDGGVFGSYSRSMWSIDFAGDALRTGGYIPAAESERGSVDAPANSRHANGVLTMGRRFGLDGKNRAFVRGNVFAERRDNGTSLTINRTYFRQAAAGVDVADSRFGSLRFRAFVEAQVYDQTFSAISNNRNTETLSRIQRVPSQAAGANLGWSRAVREHFLTAGIEAREVRGFSDETIFVGGNATSLVGSGGRERSISFYAQDAWQATRKFALHVGARLDRWNNFDAQSATRNLASGATTVTIFPERTEYALSPRLAVVYEIDPRFSLFASFNRSFRAPTLNELYRAFRVGNVLTLANENLKAERANSFDTGVSYSKRGGRLWLRGTFFASAVTDPVVSVTLTTTPSLITRQRQNVGETRATGLELDAEFRVRSDVKLSAGYLFVDSRVKDNPASPDLVHKFVPQVARHQLTFQVIYSPQRFSLGLQARASSGQFEDDLNSLRLRPYFTADGFASYRVLKRLEFFAALENIFDSRYDIGRTPNLTIAGPRSVRAGLRFDLAKR